MADTLTTNFHSSGVGIIVSGRGGKCSNEPGDVRSLTVLHSSGLNFSAPKSSNQKKVSIKKKPSSKKKKGKPTVRVAIQEGKRPPMTVRVRGKGAYTYDSPGPWGRVGREVGEILGAHYGGPSGAKIGGKLGSYAHYIGRIFGSGDYATSGGFITRNNLVNPDQIPEFSDTQGTIRVAHREYLFDVYSSTTAGAFSIQNLAINPGLQSTFPWLSSLASTSFQQYRINGMIFEFKSTSSELSTSVGLGYVVMATDYDSTDVPFTNKAQMENTELSVSSKPSGNSLHAIECARRLTSVSEQYIRSGALPAGQDIRLADLGRFSIATGGVPTTNTNLGELWVSYDVTLIKPIMYAPSLSLPCARYTLTNAAGITTAPLVPLTTLYDNIGVSCYAGNYLQFPYNIQIGSCYYVQINITGAAGTATGTPIWSNSAWFTVNRVYGSPNPSGSTTIEQAASAVVIYTGGANPLNPPSLLLTNAGTRFAAVTSSFLYITQVSSNFLN